MSERLKHKLFTGIWIVMALIALVSCRHELKNEGIVLAKVGDHYLLEEDVKGMLPEGTTGHDSIQMIKSYIRKWVETQLMVDQAKKNLPEEQLNFEKQLNDYRNSLIIYKYETRLVKQKLDTVVSDEEIRHYYKNHLNDFELKENIVKVIYIILPHSEEESNEAKKLKKIFRHPDSLLFDSIESIGMRLSVPYCIDTNSWIRFNDLIENIPIETYNQELYLKNHRFIDITDDRYLYLLKFVNFKIKDEVSPLDFEKRHIKSILINKRKNNLLRKLRQDVLNKGIKENKFEIY